MVGLREVVVVEEIAIFGPLEGNPDVTSEIIKQVTTSLKAGRELKWVFILNILNPALAQLVFARRLPVRPRVVTD